MCKSDWAVYGWFEGSFDPVSMEIPKKSISISASPNPFNQHSLVSFTIERPGDIRLAIYNITGREVAVLAEGYYPAGMSKVVWDASSTASGVYFVKLTSGDFTRTRKLLLLK